MWQVNGQSETQADIKGLEWQGIKVINMQRNRSNQTADGKHTE